MEDYIGIDVSMKEPALTIRRGGQRVARGLLVVGQIAAVQRQRECKGKRSGDHRADRQEPVVRHQTVCDPAPQAGGRTAQFHDLPQSPCVSSGT